MAAVGTVIEDRAKDDKDVVLYPRKFRPLAIKGYL